MVCDEHVAGSAVQIICTKHAIHLAVNLQEDIVVVRGCLGKSRPTWDWPEFQKRVISGSSTLAVG